MLIRVPKRLYSDGKSTRLGLPKVWTATLGLSGGDQVEIAFDETLLLVIPRRSARAERMLQFMTECR